MPVYLADTSAWHRSGAVFERWASLSAGRELATCPPVALELLYSARSKDDYLGLRDHLAGFVQLPLDERASDRAGETQASLAERAQHRGPTPVDLLVAAIAEVNDAVLLHYDRHFESIVRVSGQPAEWLARRGSLD